MAIISFLSITLLALLIPAETLIERFNSLKFRIRSEYQRGKDLLIEVSQLNLMGDLTQLSNYKFYDSLICEIAQIAKEFGAATSRTLAKMRHALSNDLQIEKKAAGTINETLFQFLMAMGLTFALNIFATNILGLATDYTFLVLALIYNLVGVLSFIMLIKKLKRKFLAPISKILNSYLIFKLMYDVGTPINQLIHRSSINSIVDLDQALAKDLFRRLAALIEVKKHQGVDICEDLESIEINLWDDYRSENEVFLQRLKIFKFIWLVVFFFVPYVANFFRLISHLNL
ncbi:hypothetical protein [Halobacteriovorax sp. DA5]|uniref:hypothetical protein n=1 Tax=unclassified Halobacteriovorax TaxID=2639665 RepID=UPI0011AF140A|nr:hypothetical protein [Halobacteriovorax sp. DA5]